MLDTKSHVETPEGVRLPISYASFCPRAYAYALDLFIRLAVLGTVSSILAYTGKMGSGLLLILAFAQEWFYPVLFEVFNQGATPGKKIMQLQVVHDDGSPVSFSSSLLRNLLSVVDFLPVFYCLGSLVSICHPMSKRLGDIAAGTLVIYKSSAGRHAALDTSLGKQPIPLGLNASDQRVLVNFAERCSNLSLARQNELANILAPILNQDSSTPPLQTIKQIANQIAGTPSPIAKEASNL